MAQTFGFIMTRCVKDDSHRPMWQECYHDIRKLYSEQIIIVDDNSNELLIDDIELVNVRVIKSEFPGTGELLGYYYFYKLKPFDKAVVLHDSMFIKEPLNMEINGIKFLWHFDSHLHYNYATESEYISLLDNNEGLKHIYDNKLYLGCFGVASIMTYEYVEHLHTKYDLFKLLYVVQTRENRMSLERILALLAYLDGKVTNADCSVMGCIMNHHRAMYLSFNEYKSLGFINYIMVKVWSGR
jgi:hypothetical protein